MSLDSLHTLPFAHVDDSQLHLLLNNNVNLSTHSLTTIPPSPYNHLSLNNIDCFEHFLADQDDLSFFSLCKYYAPHDISSPNFSQKIL
jgi:hypothetical protein